MNGQQQRVQGPAPLDFFCVLDVPLELRGAPCRLVGSDGVQAGQFRCYSEVDFGHQPQGVPEIQVVTEREWWRYVMLREFPAYVWWPATHVFTTG